MECVNPALEATVLSKGYKEAMEKKMGQKSNREQRNCNTLKLVSREYMCSVYPY